MFGSPISGTIQIEPVANGWIVTIPCTDCLTQMPDMHSMVRENARVFREELNKDEVLAKIQHENQEPDENTQPKKLQISDLKNKHVHIFKTFSEVLKFLKEKVK